MSVTYTVTDAATTFQVSYRAIGPDGFLNFTYNTVRGFMQFDLSGEGIAPGSIESAELIIVCASVIGGGAEMQLKSSTSAGWGATLDATSGDFQSTMTNLEDTQTISSTGTKTWTLDPANIDTAGITYYRLQCTLEAESAPYSKGATFASQNHGTAANRPILRLTLFTGQVIFVHMI